MTDAQKRVLALMQAATDLLLEAAEILIADQSSGLTPEEKCLVVCKLGTAVSVGAGELMFQRASTEEERIH